MAKMNPTQKKAFLARMAKGRRNAGAASMGAKSAGMMRSYIVEDERTGRVLGTYRAASPAAAISACMRAHPGHSRAMLNAHAMPRATGRVAGAAVKRSSTTRKRKAGAALARVPSVLPKRKGHARGKVGGGSPAVRMSRIETAVIDLARANHAIVSKVVEHERRLNSVETTLSNWAKGRK